jgi:sulfite reductase (NADPH) flavoprotein alpha-component
MSGDLNPEQKRDREGFVAGLQIAKAARESAGAPSAAGTKPAELSGSDAAHLRAQAMPLADRMKLAEGRPLRRRMMAAMGQQDCGQCGYNCQDYSDAIFLKKEERLNLCVPGGKETTRPLKAPHQELGRAPAAETPSKTPTPAAATVALAAAPGCSRECPTEAHFLSRTRLNKASSAKETWHIEFDLTASGIDYAVGDVFGVFPTNDPAFVANLKKSGRYQQDVY